MLVEAGVCCTGIHGQGVGQYEAVNTPGNKPDAAANCLKIAHLK